MPAMMQQIANRRRRDGRIGEIDVREVGRDESRADDQRSLRFRRARPHHRVGERDAYQRMRDVVHYGLTAAKRNRT